MKLRLAVILGFVAATSAFVVTKHVNAAIPVVTRPADCCFPPPNCPVSNPDCQGTIPPQ